MRGDVGGRALASCGLTCCPLFSIREGQTLVGGSIIGEVYENELMKNHKIMVPPGVFGEVVKVRLQ